VSHILSDVVNPIGAITGVDPVKDATGFTGTSFGPTKAQQQAAAAGGGAPASGGGGGSKSNGDAMQALVGQNFAKQQAAIQQQPQQQAPMGSSFGNQLAALHQQVTAPPAALPAIASPSATQLAANVTSQTVGKQMQQPQGQQNMWGFPSIYAPR
jgi:hypothetical protein